MLSDNAGRLTYEYDSEKLWVEPWGPNALRVRATKSCKMPAEDWALLQPAQSTSAIDFDQGCAVITNGRIKAVVTKGGKLTIFNSHGERLLEEYSRNRRDLIDPMCSALEIESREFKGISGGDYHITARFESISRTEKIYGMGQYQQPGLDLKGSDVELAHRNSQASVPFAMSSLGYGLLWNNPSVGRAVFGTNMMTFEARSSKVLDYWVVAGNNPAQIVEAYADATGKVPMMPEYGLGFWQSKLRYQTQEELLSVAREYRKRELPIDVIVIDFFHWPKQGEWMFDPTYWPDVDSMVKELQQLKIELMVSIWPTVDKKSKNFIEMVEHGFLIRAERGVRTGLDFEGETIHFDATNPAARSYVWDKCRQNYYSKGIRVFWLDEAEPEYTVYDFDNYRYFLGSNLAIGNIYPRDYSRAFYEGMAKEGQTNIVNLVRCAWAGSQKFGALVWSGDIASSWASLRNQLAAGLNMGIAGLPWWTTDIGGFHGGDPNDVDYRELFVRWFQWGTFCPVMRLHGDREPRQPQQGTSGGATCCSGAANEVWSYGDKVFEICKTYMGLREHMRDYTRELMLQAHEKGSPVMRTLFYEFPHDPVCWNVETQYMYGDKYLCCPVLQPAIEEMDVYLPAAENVKWKALNSERIFEAGQWIKANCPLSTMPVFVKV